jgi:hypothetical protein
MCEPVHILGENFHGGEDRPTNESSASMAHWHGIDVSPVRSVLAVDDAGRIGLDLCR